MLHVLDELLGPPIWRPVNSGCLPFTKTIRLEISGINIKQLNAKLQEWVSL